MLILTFCSKCQHPHEIAESLRGDTILCQKCGESFVVIEVVPDEPDTIDVESIFERDGGAQAQSDQAEHPFDMAPGEKKKTLAQILVVGPPPEEKWTGDESQDEPFQRLRDFRPDSRAVTKFRRRDDATDYSWLLIVGLVVMTLSICACQGFMGLLILLK